MSPRVAVLGSINMDLVVRAPRFPAPGETLLGRGFAAHPGGKGANQAVAAARLFAGQPLAVALIGRLGADAHGRQLRDLLEREGVDVDAVGSEPDAPTGVAAITVSDSGENQIVVAAGANATLTGALVEAQAERLRRAAVVVAQLEVPDEAVLAGARLARAGGALLVLNAAPARELPAELMRSVDVLVVNQGEAALLAGGEGAPEDLGARLLARGVGAVALTLGARGALWLDARGARSCPAPRVEAVDTTGAGDAFVGALAHALALGLVPAEALRRACAAGALAVTRAGAIPSLPVRQELEILLSAFPPGEGGSSCGPGRP
jgi:ribokinase